MRKLFTLRRNERGDTIIEVLIAIAVVSLILGGAYVTTNNSLRAERGAQERTDATKLVEAQLESIKSIASTTPDAIFVTAPGNFCITPAQAVVLSTISNGNCKFSSTGANNNGAEPIYNLSASISTASGVDTLTIKNTWNAIETGSATDVVQMSYRLYP